MIYVGLDNCYFRDVQSYKGKINVTNTGLPCLRWDSLQKHNMTMSPFEKSSVTHADNYPDASIAAANNYCRQPRVMTIKDGLYRPWCYNSEKRAEYCDIPHCPGQCNKVKLHSNIISILFKKDRAVLLIWPRLRQFASHNSFSIDTLYFYSIEESF